MLLVRNAALAVPSEHPTAVTIGAYDGVHVGHRAVIDRVRALAEARSLTSAVVTFDRHPASVVRPESAPKLICDPEQKLELLASTGIDATWQVVFDSERAAEAAEDFVRSILVEKLRAKLVVIGEDFHFGKGRRGNVDLLRSLGSEFGFDVLGIDLVGRSETDGDATTSDVGEKVSSTEIRRCISVGDVTHAASLLGRFHELRGSVIHGDARGRTLGFPTANVAVAENICLPADGIYACWFTRPNGDRLPAAVNLGRRPTFYEDQNYSLLEAFVLDFSGDLYGEQVHVEFVERLRPEAKFDSLDALIAQMNLDVERARQILAKP